LSTIEIDMRELRNAFGCFATGITVVTALDSDGGAVGITANSFSSLSLDPPLVLWSIDKRSTTYPVFATAPHFVVSVLSAEGAPIASRYAMKGGHEIQGESTVPTAMGPPTFADSLAVFECDVFARHEGGDHVIMVGKIRRFTHLPEDDGCDRGPLLYFRGRFGNVAPLTE
jgi:flavin reductase (DIM6/NTAB) family NADH-FMN oxidoreductase RutF